MYICEVNGETAEVELNVLGKHYGWMDGLYTVHHTCRDIIVNVFVREGKELIMCLGYGFPKKCCKCRPTEPGSGGPQKACS